MSDSREALRRHFEIDAEFVVVAALDALRQDGLADAGEVAKAIEALGVDTEKLDAATV
jgi:pyruvate dehydrogenase E1 component